MEYHFCNSQKNVGMKGLKRMYLLGGCYAMSSITKCSDELENEGVKGE